MKETENQELLTLTQQLVDSIVAADSYLRLTQSLDASGVPQTSRCEETRVWQKQGEQWKHVHFHRSANA